MVWVIGPSYKLLLGMLVRYSMFHFSSLPQKKWLGTVGIDIYGSRGHGFKGKARGNGTVQQM